MVGHELTGISLLFTRGIAEGRAHLDQGIALYDPDEHRPLVTRFGKDVRMAMLMRRAEALWLLGYPDAATDDTNRGLEYVREIGLAAPLMFALSIASENHILSGNYATAKTLVEEGVALAEEKGTLFWKAVGEMNQGCVFALTGKASSAIQMITSGVTAWRSTGSTMWTPMYLSYLAMAHAELGQFDDAWRCIGEAITAAQTTKERCAKPTSTESPGKSRCCRRSLRQRRRKGISSVRLRLRTCSSFH